MDDAAHRALILPLLNEIGAINKRYGFRARDSRSPEDNARFDDLWAQIRAVDDRYDAANPSRLTFERWAAAVQEVGIPPKGEPSCDAGWLFEALRAPPPVRTVVDLPSPLLLPAHIVVTAEVVTEVEALGREMEHAILRSVL